jgi:hypothetical protein
VVEFDKLGNSKNTKSAFKGFLARK